MCILPVGNPNGTASKTKSGCPTRDVGIDGSQDSGCAGTATRLRNCAAYRADQRRFACGQPRDPYPVLLKLGQEGAIASEWGASENNRRARFYRLTREGRKQLQVETQDWEQTAAIIARFFEVKAEDFS